MDNNVSEIDDPNFFFADDGATNPQHELQATLDAFFSDEKRDDNSSICRFPARYAWLQKELNATDFPSAVCSEYDKIFDRVDPKSTTLVFPAAHINSPASMFGHTFLRINSSYHSKLLSYAVNYAANANADTENGVVFAIKGLVGGYYGRYSLLPYYEKLKEYRDSEQRDIWEYDLDLSQILVKQKLFECFVIFGSLTGQTHTTTSLQKTVHTICSGLLKLQDQVCICVSSFFMMSYL